MVRIHLGDVRLEDRGSRVVRTIGLCGIAVSFHGYRNTPSRLTETMAKTSSPGKEIDSGRLGILGRDPLLSSGAKGDKYASVTSRLAAANRPSVMDKVDMQPLSCTSRNY